MDLFVSEQIQSEVMWTYGFIKERGDFLDQLRDS